MSDGHERTGRPVNSQLAIVSLSARFTSPYSSGERGPHGKSYSEHVFLIFVIYAAAEDIR